MNVGYLTADIKDEYYTPKEAVTPLLEFLDKNSIIWCPFDTKDSEYVKILSNNGNKVIFSHIEEGKDFFNYEPEKYDLIISNPPFSCKDEVLKRLHNLNKPYAMLFPLPTLQGQKRFQYLQDCQALIFDKRINFYQDVEHTIRAKNVAFASIYICKNFLPKDLIFRKL